MPSISHLDTFDVKTARVVCFFCVCCFGSIPWTSKTNLVSCGQTIPTAKFAFLKDSPAYIKVEGREIVLVF